MKCPKCGSVRSSVVDSRGDPNAIRRRRECQECEFRFTTYERIEYALPLVIKKDGRREPFDMRKLKGGLMRACEKRPISIEQIDSVLSGIERRVNELCVKEIESIKIGDLVMEELKTLDHIAYIRFASVYQEFNDIGQFLETLQSLGGNSEKGGKDTARKKGELTLAKAAKKREVG